MRRGLRKGMKGCIVSVIRCLKVPIPMPFGRLHFASVLADKMAACAASTEVVNPKDRSMMSMSLSMV